MDEAEVMRRVAATRTAEKVPDRALREFLEKPVALAYPEPYHRVLEIERMASVSRERPATDWALHRWWEMERRLDALAEECGSQEQLLAAVCNPSREELREDLFVWALLDRAGLLDSGEERFDFLAAAECAVLTRLEEEGNPEGSRRADATTELYAMCVATRGNRLRVGGEVVRGFELVRTAVAGLRPGGNGYVTGKVYSFFTSAAIAAGNFELAHRKAAQALKVFQDVEWNPGIVEVTNHVHHLAVLNGRSSRELLQDLLSKYQDAHDVPRRLIVYTKINLVGALIYFHEADGARPILEELNGLTSEAPTSLWYRQFEAILLLRDGFAREASRDFKDVRLGFFELGLPNQAHFVGLLEALSLGEAGDFLGAMSRAKDTADYYLSSRFYGSLASQAAADMLKALHEKNLDRMAILKLIDVVLSPAKERTGGARGEISRWGRWLGLARRSPTSSSS